MVKGGVSIQMNFASSPCLFGQNQGARNNIIIIIIIIYLLTIIIIIYLLLLIIISFCLSGLTKVLG